MVYEKISANRPFSTPLLTVPKDYPNPCPRRATQPSSSPGKRQRGCEHDHSPYPPINVFQQGEDILAIIELPGIDKDSLQIQAKDNAIRIAGQKIISYPQAASVHRRERVSGDFDRTLSLPVQLDADGIKAEYRDGVLALFLPRAERDRARTIKIS